MTTKKSFWKRCAEWVTALRDRPLKSARFKLTALYAALTLLVLIIFNLVLNYFRAHILKEDLANQIDPRALSFVVSSVTSHLQNTTFVLSFFLLIAITIISYFSVQLTLRPIKTFLEAHRRFIADASHELRTPLATMRTEIDVALLDPDGLTQKESIEILKSNLEEIERMSKILTNLLNLASFNDATGKPPMVPVNLGEILRNSVDRVSKAAKVKKIDIDQNGIEDVKVLGNITALEEVAFNLLKNSVNYSHPNSRVEVSLSENRNMARLEIRDEGVGIAPEELHHVFEPFYRSERSLHMHATGSGLGLPLAKEIIRKHNGSINVESVPDQGTVIKIDLPLA